MLVGCFGFNGPLTQYFRLYRAVSPRNGWLVVCFGFNGPLRQYFCLSRAVLLVWMIVGQGPIALAVGAGGDCSDIFSLIYLFSFLSPSLWETARYRLKYCLKGPLNPKQPTNQQKRIPAPASLAAWAGQYLSLTPLNPTHQVPLSW